MFVVGDKAGYRFYDVVFPCQITKIDIVRGDPIKTNDRFSLRHYQLHCKISAKLPNGEVITDDITEFCAII